MDGKVTQKTLSIIIPTYNERENIQPLMERIQKAFPRDAYEVVFVDDNSRDGTADAIKSLKGYPVKLLVRTDKRGLASAVMDGVELASAPVIGVMDADLQHPPEVLPTLLDSINAGADIAIASRYVEGGDCRGWSLTRRVISKGAIMLAHLFLPLTRKVHDPMSGYFMFRKQSIDMKRLKPTGFKILLEMLVAGGARQTTEVPYVFDVRSRGESKLSSRTQIDYLRHLWSLFLRTGELLRFFKFIFVGLTGVGVNLGLLWLLAEKGKVVDWLSSGVAIEVSIIWNFILNNAFTFRDRNAPGIGPFIKRLLKFNAVSLPGWAINFGVALFFRDVVGLDRILAQALGIIPATLWNYILNMVWTWR